MLHGQTPILQGHCANRIDARPRMRSAPMGQYPMLGSAYEALGLELHSLGFLLLEVGNIPIPV